MMAFSALALVASPRESTFFPAQASSLERNEMLSEILAHKSKLNGKAPNSAAVAQPKMWKKPAKLPDGRVWELAKTLCDTSEGQAPNLPTIERWCSLSRRHTLLSKLHDVTRCWRRKLAGTSSPGAWRQLVRVAYQGFNDSAIEIEPVVSPSQNRVLIPAASAKGRVASGAAVSEDTPAMTRQQAFERVYSTREWAGGATGRDPLSGSGSSVANTRAVRVAILDAVQRFGIKHIVDAPCGDLTWASTLFHDLERLNVSYYGLDVVRSQIARHRRLWAKPGVRDFAVADLAVALPLTRDNGTQLISDTATMILCRQALQHLNAYDAVSERTLVRC